MVSQEGLTRGGSAFRNKKLARRTGANLTCSIPIDTDGYTPNLRLLVKVLKTQSGLSMYRHAFRENMLYKVKKYDELQMGAEEDAQKHLQIINIKVPELKRLAGVEGESDNWHIFESLSGQYRDAKDRAAGFEAIKLRARGRLEGIDGKGGATKGSVMDVLRCDLVDTLANLSNFSSQSHVVSKAVDIVSSFIKNPKLFRTKLMNFMLLGGAGTGKTSIASAIGDVFAKAGMFVGNKLTEAGRAELVGQYEGQTVARTRNFLTSNLDNGVIFIDEAYSITPWQDGKPEGYGSEAATAMVEFMTRYPGLYCIIVAGYETQMIRYFLNTNDGIPRRFPNKYVLCNMSVDNLVDVFKRSLLKTQGFDVPNGKCAYLESTSYFSCDAWEYLRRLIDVCTDGDVEYREEHDQSTRKTYQKVRVFKPTWEYMYKIFENQAGSMTNLADEAIMILMCTISYQRVIEQQQKNKPISFPLIQEQPVHVMRDVIVQTIMKSSFSEASVYLAQLSHIDSIIC